MSNAIAKIKDFLLLLDKDYGFCIDVARLETCLSCANDITNLEEVLFRIQAMVCKSEEQVKQFQSLFAQYFLKDYLNQISEEGKHKEVDINEVINEIKRKLQKQEEKRKKNEDEIEKLAKEETLLREYIKSETENLEQKIKKANEIANGDKQELLKNTPMAMMMQDERVKKKIEHLVDKVLDAVDNSAVHMPKWNSAPKDRNEMKEKIDKALNELDGILRLENYASTYLENASEMDSKTKAFKDLVTLSKALSVLVDACKKAVGTKSIIAVKSVNKAKEKIESNFESEKRAIYENRKLLSEKQSSLEWKKMQAESNKENIKKHKEELHKAETIKEAKESTVIKKSSKNHRNIFTTQNAHAVQTVDEVEKLLNTPLPYMNNKDIQKVLTFIRTNANIFRQTLRRKSTTPMHHEIDIKKTLRIAAKTNGEPFRIKYKEPKKSHAKIVCLVDVSGSCRAAASLALYFMAMMNEAFPGGCKKFAFVNHLVSVDKYFVNCSAADGVEAINKNVKSKGIYSDYGETISELRKDYSGLFHKDTTVIILGDARNNNNASATEDLKFIVNHSRKVFWLNPDKPVKWNQGDSVVSEYVQAGVTMHHISTVGDLLGFLTKESSSN